MAGDDDDATNIDDVNAVLGQFDGGYGRLVRYSDGMEMLRIEVIRERRRCDILCKGCVYLATPTVWSESVLRVTRLKDDVIELLADNGEPKIRCWVVRCEVSETDDE